ncbi:alpha/beta fold hydrolase [Emticicia sp. SJ17W-69]|uniref:alpha/beta hydrolase n=1 Tax=Emticicia sp. SJ17W-69 TaxID=3421657 RepID=UPI003EB8AFB8
MIKHFLFFVLLLFINVRANAQKQTYVFVHGAWGGGWEYKMVDSMLSAQGHQVYRPTMTGLGERVHLANSEINLSTHIQDIVNMILFENLHDITLVGHSYGGMVISGVAERIPERIAKLIYLDAFVPNDGESLFTARGENEARAMIMPHVKDGMIEYFFGPTKPTPPTDVPHPLKTQTETLSIKNPAVKSIQSFYILMLPSGDANKANFAFFAQRAKERGWKMIEMNGDHYPMRNQVKNFIITLSKCK